MHVLLTIFDCAEVDQGGDMLGKGWDGTKRV